jgi:hypothetical protein
MTMWTLTFRSAWIEEGHAADSTVERNWDDLAADLGSRHSDDAATPGGFFSEPSVSDATMVAGTGHRRRTSHWPHFPPRPAPNENRTNGSRGRRRIDWPLLIFWLVYLALFVGIVWMLAR